MSTVLFAAIFYEDQGNRIVLHAMPILLGVLCALAIAYRYYSAFLAARVMALDDARTTPAHLHYDGQNYHPTNKWVLFGHHFAAISGAGPLIGPVLAIQYGYMPGLLWLVIGVCLAGAVQDMLVLAASVRRDGKSLAEIARTELGKPAATVASVAILFIVIIALAGLGIVVVKALGGETVSLPEGMRLELAAGTQIEPVPGHVDVYQVPAGAKVFYPKQEGFSERSEAFRIQGLPSEAGPGKLSAMSGAVVLTGKWQQLVAGSSWGTFTIACTIPIALFVGLYMYRIRKGHVVEASLIGAIAVLAATVAGSWVPGSALESYFSLTKEQTILSLTGYGFIASVLPVWMLLCPRDYLSSFLKIGTIGLLVIGVIVANPKLECPPVNYAFMEGGPTFPGKIFPFVFICIMCGAISGFHALVSSGTTPKMIDRETHIRPIGYGAMLMEGLVGIMALIAASSLDTRLYYDINVELSQADKYQDSLNKLYAEMGLGKESRDPLHAANVDSPQHLPVPSGDDLATIEQQVGGESLRGRTGGAVTLAVGMAQIFKHALAWTGMPIAALMKYWYHFAIMFEALFILTTIDTGTRIARFLLQEALGKIYTPFERPDWLPGAVFSTLMVTTGWGILIHTGSISTIWPMFGIANQLLAVLALCLVTTMLINSGRARYAVVTILPMLFVTTTTMTAGAQLIAGRWMAQGAYLNIGLTLFVMASVGAVLLLGVVRWVGVLAGMIPTTPQREAVAQ